MAEDTLVRQRIRNASLLLMGSILLSRIIGFFREWILAYTLGANAMTDVYYASFTIPDILNYLMAAGALSISFIPMITQYEAEGRADFAKEVFRVLSTFMGGILLVLILIAELFAYKLSQWIAPGFTGSQLELLAYLIRIILPAQIFFYWGGLAIAVQQANGRFLLPALAPIFYNSTIILFGVILHRWVGVVGFSIGVLVGSFVSHGVTQAVGVTQLGFSYKPLVRWTPEHRAALNRYLALTFPIMLGFSIVVTEEWFSKYFASHLQARTISWLSYARTEMRIPVAILGQAAGVASFPYLSRLWSQSRYQDYTRTLFIEIQKLWGLAPVAAILLVVFALPTTHFIYGGGKLTGEDLVSTARALQLFGIGIFFWTAQVLLARGFYAVQKTWVPPILGGIASLSAIPLYTYLAQRMGFEGLALAGTLAIFVYFALLSVGLVILLGKFDVTLSVWRLSRALFSWVPVLFLVLGIAYFLRSLGIYRGDRWSALAEVLLAGGISCALVLPLFRIWLKKMAY